MLTYTIDFLSIVRITFTISEKKKELYKDLLFRLFTEKNLSLQSATTKLSAIYDGSMKKVL